MESNVVQHHQTGDTITPIRASYNANVQYKSQINKKTARKRREMAKFEKGNKKGKKTLFTSDNQPSNRGRKPKLYTIAKKKYNISHEEYKDVISYLMQCTKKEINGIAEDENTPIWIVNLCRALYKDSGRGEVKTLNDITERIFGKIPNTTEITGKDGKDLIPRIDIEIIDKREDVDHEDTDD